MTNIIMESMKSSIIVLPRPEAYTMRFIMPAPGMCAPSIASLPCHAPCANGLSYPPVPNPLIPASPIIPPWRITADPPGLPAPGINGGIHGIPPSTGEPAAELGKLLPRPTGSAMPPCPRIPGGDAAAACTPARETCRSLCVPCSASSTFALVFESQRKTCVCTSAAAQYLESRRTGLAVRPDTHAPALL